MSYNRAYHGYFEGYVEREAVDVKTGRVRIERIYAGDYYRHKLDDKAWKLLKLKYALSYLWAFAAMVIAGVTGDGTGQWYVAIPVMLSLLAFLWMGYFLCGYLLHPRDLLIRQYRARKQLISMAMACVISTGLTLLGKAVWMIANLSLSGLWGMAMGASGIVLMYWIFRTEQDMEYVKRANNATIPKDSYDIRFHEEE